MTNTPRFENIRRIHHDLSQPTSQPVEPMHSIGSAPGRIPDVLLFSESLFYTPSFEEILDIYLRNFTGPGIPKSHRIQPINVDVVVSHDELAGRTHLPVRVPLFHVCQRCGGSGHAGFFTCDQCNGAGILEEIRTLDVIIPHVGPEGAAIPVSLSHMGIENLYVNLRVTTHA